MRTRIVILEVMLLAGILVGRAFADKAVAEIKSPSDPTISYGKVRFEDREDGVQVHAELVNVKPAGQHGIHIHQYGSCANDGKAAGDHYNPSHTPHGHVKNGPQKSHPGDMGNIEIKEDGTGVLDIYFPGVNVAGAPYSIGGRTVVLHEKTDDFSQPSGNAGTRMGCGTILLSDSQDNKL